MNRFYIVIVMLLSGCLIAGKLFAAPPEVEKARQHGAQGEVTLLVVDSTGKPVEKAKLSVAFWGSDSSADVVASEGQTDPNGLFVAAGKTIGSMNYTITKDGYYKTTGKYWFYRPSGLDSNKNSAASPTSGEYWLYHQQENSVKDDRWQPWNPTITLVLKERRQPIAMYAKRIDAPVPVRDTPVGFDLEVGDWVLPHGAGKQADVYFTYKANAQDFWTGSYELTIACSNKMDGLVRMRKDMWSEFLSAYEAPNDGYDTGVVLSLDMTKDKILKKDLFGAEEYLIFRVRMVLDDKGNITSARYGKIYGPIEFGRIGKVEENRGGVRFTCYFNPTANDRNLEFDPSQNLFNWRHDARERPYMP
ncbi:MAG TPA: hypothetical protein DCZ95_10245 [Verrucomicrobia bacterium]|nr:MAG: hypothetical protein A2X46_18895 [Lentisphaerae bacterium GWF2_57_35]HBA84462.1 hypothetical protein [Verrucomicrobiota bacterium]